MPEKNPLKLTDKRRSARPKKVVDPFGRDSAESHQAASEAWAAVQAKNPPSPSVGGGPTVLAGMSPIQFDNYMPQKGE